MKQKLYWYPSGGSKFYAEILKTVDEETRASGPSRAATHLTSRRMVAPPTPTERLQVTLRPTADTHVTSYFHANNTSDIIRTLLYQDGDSSSLEASAQTRKSTRELPLPVGVEGAWSPWSFNLSNIKHSILSATLSTIDQIRVQNRKRSSATITGGDLLVTEYMFSQGAPHLPDAEASEGWSWADGSGVCAEKRWAGGTPHTHPASSVPQDSNGVSGYLRRKTGTTNPLSPSAITWPPDDITARLWSCHRPVRLSCEPEHSEAAPGGLNVTLVLEPWIPVWDQFTDR